MALKEKLHWEENKEKLRVMYKRVICKLKKFFGIKCFSKGQMLFFCITILVGTFLYDVPRFMVFIGFTLATWFMGYAGLRHVRAILERAEQRIESPNVPVETKFTEAIEAVHASCDLLGRVMDRLNLKQGTAPYIRDLVEKKNGGE